VRAGCAVAVRTRLYVGVDAGCKRSGIDGEGLRGGGRETRTFGGGAAQAGLRACSVFQLGAGSVTKPSACSANTKQLEKRSCVPLKRGVRERTTTGAPPVLPHLTSVGTGSCCTAILFTTSMVALQKL
jgi:hypothetical protein